MPYGLAASRCRILMRVIWVAIALIFTWRGINGVDNLYYDMLYTILVYKFNKNSLLVGLYLFDKTFLRKKCYKFYSPERFLSSTQ